MTIPQTSCIPLLWLFEDVGGDEDTEHRRGGDPDLDLRMERKWPDEEGMPSREGIMALHIQQELEKLVQPLLGPIEQVTVTPETGLQPFTEGLGNGSRVYLTSHGYEWLRHQGRMWLEVQPEILIRGWMGRYHQKYVPETLVETIRAGGTVAEASSDLARTGPGVVLYEMGLSGGPWDLAWTFNGCVGKLSLRVSHTPIRSEVHLRVWMDPDATGRQWGVTYFTP